MRPGMHTEIWRIVLVGLFSLFFGWSLGFPFGIILCGVGLYVIWTFRTISLLFGWIDKGMRGIPPDADGVWGEISDTLNRQRRRHRRTQEKMRRTINRVSRLTEALDEGILVLRSDLSLDWWNSSAASLLGLRSSDRGSAIMNLMRDPEFVEYINQGKILSLISDAGTPAVSDPGAILVNECLNHKIDVIPLPGPSAVSTAVSISGFKEQYFFYGFFPEKKSQLTDDFEKLSKLDCSIVFFISSKKFNKFVEVIKQYFSSRKILICREMTKLYEEYIRTDINDLKPFEKQIKGELTIVISEIKNVKNLSIDLKESDKLMIKRFINKLSVKDITDLISQKSEVKKKNIYNYCLKLKNEK